MGLFFILNLDSIAMYGNQTKRRRDYFDFGFDQWEPDLFSLFQFWTWIQL